MKIGKIKSLITRDGKLRYITGSTTTWIGPEYAVYCIPDAQLDITALGAMLDLREDKLADLMVVRGRQIVDLLAGERYACTPLALSVVWCGETLYLYDVALPDGHRIVTVPAAAYDASDASRTGAELAAAVSDGDVYLLIAKPGRTVTAVIRAEKPDAGLLDTMAAVMGICDGLTGGDDHAED